MKTIGTRRDKVSGRILVMLFLTSVFLWQACDGDDEGDKAFKGPSLGNIEILEPHQGKTIQEHSVRFSVSLSPDLDPGGLRVMLNLEDRSSHLRITGSEAVGYVSGMKDGENVLLFTAPGIVPGTGIQVAQVRFTFDPIHIEEIEQSKEYILPGLEGVVDVLVDPWGVHHAYPREDNPDDLLFMQGYIMAKHRLFQIDMLRKAAEGRLTELAGTLLDKSVLEMDMFYRTMFLSYDRDRGEIRHIHERQVQDLAARKPTEFGYLTRFVEGVNAYIDDLKHGRNDAVLPQQYELLNLAFFFAPHYEIEPMTEAQVMAIGRLMSYELSGSLYQEISLAGQKKAIQEVGEQDGLLPQGTFQDLLRVTPADRSTVLKPGEDHYVGPLQARNLPRSVSLADDKNFRGEASGEGTKHTELLKRLERTHVVLWGSQERAFSNNWILGPSMTANGFPILCNDPHLSLTNPSIFYPLHGDNTLIGGEFNISGLTFPGLPGILVGQNENLAWGATVTCYDVTDIYEEEVTVDGEDKYVTYYGTQVPVETILQTFKIRGGDAVLGFEPVIPIDYVPHHGPQVPGDPYRQDPGLTPENNLTVAWTGHFLTREIEAILGLFAAKNIDDFFASLENFGVGAQNFVGATTDGEIGYFPMAKIPVRKDGAMTEAHPPYLPLPGTGGYEWQDAPGGGPLFLPTEQVPQAKNPSRGWLATANNDIIGSTLDNDVLNDDIYLYYTATTGLRSGRITERILALEKEQRDLEAMKQIQGDHVSPPAQRLRPFFLEAAGNQEVTGSWPAGVRARLEEARTRVEAWDPNCPTGMPDPFSNEPPSAEEVSSSVAASIFFVWLNRLTEAVFDDELALVNSNLGSSDRMKALLHILEDVDEPPTSPDYVNTIGPDGQSRLWNNVGTDEAETRDEVMVAALKKALDDLASLMESEQMDTWQWGKIHTVTFELEGVGSMVQAFNLPSVSLLEQLLQGLLGIESAGYPRPGGYETVDPAAHGLTGLDFSTGHGPAMRMVVELEEGVMRAYNVLPGGVNDLQPGSAPLGPVRIDPDTHYGDQLPLWLANKYRPQYIFWEDVTSTIGRSEKARIRFRNQ